MRADQGAGWRFALLLIVVPLLLAACGSVQIFDSFGEEETTAPVTLPSRLPRPDPR